MTPFLDHFPGSSLDTRWTSITSGTGAVTVTDSYCKIDCPANNDGAAIYHAAQIDKTRSQIWFFCISRNNQSGTFDRNHVRLVNTTPAIDTSTNINSVTLVRIGGLNAAGVGLTFAYWNSANARQEWNGGTNVWGATGVHSWGTAPATSWEVDDYYIYAIELDGPGARIRMLSFSRTSAAGFTFDQGMRNFTTTDWLLWSNMRTSTSVYLVLGNPINDLAGIVQDRVEWVRYCEGETMHSWVNGRTSGGAWSVKHWYSLGHPSVMVPEDRTTNAIAVGGGGTWDVSQVKSTSIILDAGTYYQMYSGSDATGFQIGLATASSATGPWTKDAGNPLIVRASPGNEDQVFSPCLIKDLSEPESQKRWKCIYVGFSSVDSKWRMYLATAPNATGTWTKQGLILDAGSGYDVNGAGTPVVFWNGQWEVWYGANAGGGASGWSVARAYGPTLTTLVKDNNNPLIPRQVDALQDISANLDGRTASVASTTGFVADAIVLLDQDATSDNYSVSRIRKITTDTSLELYHAEKGWTTASAAQIRQLDAGSVDIHHVEQIDGIYYFWVTLFQIYGSHGSFVAYHETTGIMSSATLLGPKTMEWMLTPPVTCGYNNNERSSENMAFVRGPLVRRGSFDKANRLRPALFAPGLAR